jgi:hypothetical protein
MVKSEVATSGSAGVLGLHRRVKLSEETLVWLTPVGQTTSVPQGIPVGCIVLVMRGPM